MKGITTYSSIKDYNREIGLETLHPLINVYDMSTLEKIKHGLRINGFYAVYLKLKMCGNLIYGHGKYDYDEGTMVFTAPGQIVGIDDDEYTYHPEGWALIFHPDLLRGTPLGSRMKDYTFFSYAINEALHTSERERDTVITCMKEIRAELEHPIDKRSKQIIASTIELLLNHCMRFYDRQFITREVQSNDVLKKFEQILLDYYSHPESASKGTPTVRYCADALHLSPNYFGDLIKKYTGKSPQEHIQLFLIEQIKERLTSSDKTVSEIAYDLGFAYPYHLSRVFKKATGLTPNEYRAQV